MMLNGIKILIGDDSILARKQLKDIVSTYGTPVFLEASNGQDLSLIHISEPTRPY